MELIPKPTITRIVLCSKNSIKSEALQAAISQLEWLEYVDVQQEDAQPPANPIQPINTGYQSSVNRIDLLQKDPTDESLVFVAIENEIRTAVRDGQETAEDVAHVTARRGQTTVTSQSVGIPVPLEYLTKARQQSDENYANKEHGLSLTVGSVIAQSHPEISSSNWMADGRFGGLDRKAQVLEPLLASLKKVYIASRITSTNDFPKPGVTFRDLSFVLSDSRSFAYVSQCLKQAIVAKGWDKKINKVMGFDARGFIYGTMVAQELGCGFFMIRKKGKLPGKTIQVKYTTEYSEDILELVAGTVQKGDQILLVDDVIATGGTFGAGIEAINQTEGKVAGCAVVMKVDPLVAVANKKIAPYEFISLF